MNRAKEIADKFITESDNIIGKDGRGFAILVEVLERELGQVDEPNAEETVFAMSMYKNATELYKAKAEYYEMLYREKAAHRWWKPMETAPKNKYIMVRGDSGMRTYPQFYIVAKLEPEYRDDWINIDNDRLTDYGYVPEEWTEIPE